MKNSNVLYYEPNYSFIAPNPDGVNMNNVVQLAPPMEDYCVVVDLEVEVPIRPLYGKVKANDTVFHVRYSSSMNGKAKVSFNQGRKYPGSDNYYLTTEPSEMGTFYDISRDNENTSEMFGINSITIEYQSYMVPVITIKFTDIRGLSLFGAEDLRHNITSSDGIKNSVNSAIAGSFFKCFFTFPYPKFKITVKGFYGNPVSYELVCSDFRANFDSSTGNFGATAKFIGYTFSVLNDITMTSLLASPYSEYFGKKYWEDNSDKFVFSDGKPMIPLLELIKRVGSISKELSRYNNSDEISSLQDVLNKIIRIKESHDRYFKILVNTIKKQGGNNGVYIIGTNNRIASSFNVESDELNNAYIDLENAIYAYNTDSFKKPVKFGTTKTNIVTLKELNYYDSEDNNIKKEFSLMDDYYNYDASLLIQKVNNLELDYKKKISAKQSDIDKYRNDKIESVIGFKPSVRNITELILAHVEVFLHEVYECAENVSIMAKDYNLSYRYEGDDKNEFYAFPTVTKTVKENQVEKKERSWVGEFDLSAPESQLVENLLKATNESYLVTKKIQENLQDSPDDASIKINTLIPTVPCDFIGFSNPYSNISIDNNYDLCGKILARALVVESSVISDNYVSAVKEIGKADAVNFYNNNKNINSSFKHKVSENGTFNTSNIIKLLLDKNSDISNNQEPIWVTKDHKSKSLLKISGTSCKCDFFNNKENTIQAVPLGDFNWDEFSSLIESMNSDGIIDNNFYTQGINCDNQNLFKIETDWKKYNDFASVKPNNNSEILDKLYDLTINTELYTMCYKKIIENDSMITTKLSILYPTINFDNNIKYPTFIPLSITNELSTNKPLLKDSDDNEVIISDSDNNKIKFTTITENELKSIYTNENNASNYTLNYFCGYNDGDISNTISIFGQIEYYYTLTHVSKEAAALMFLNTFKWDYNTIVTIISNQNMNYIPYLFAVTIGGYFYRMDNKEKFKYVKLNDYENDFKGYRYDYNEVIDSRIYNKLTNNFINVRQEIKESFKKLFIDWVSNEFNEINNQLSIQLKNNNEYTDVCDFIIKFVDRHRNRRDDFVYPSQIIQKLRDVLHDNFFINYQMIQCSLNSNNSGMKLFNRENSEIIKKITSQLLTPCFLINSIRKPVLNSNKYRSVDNLNVINIMALRSYIDGFTLGLREYLPTEENNNESLNDSIESFKTHEQIKVSLYNYLKIIWDRWLSGNPKIKDKTIWDLLEMKDRWYYIDSFYNKLTDNATINIFDFVYDITNSYDTIGASALSVMSSTYARSRFNLLCVQNFADLTNDSLMRDMFKPIPYNEIDTSKIKSVPNFIVMYTNEPSSKLDIEGSKYKNDSFMIGGDEKQLPIPILTKNSKNGYKIPAFGVTYGGQYQSYFKDISVGMESPQVTDQSLQAQFEIVKKLDSNDAVTIGQDLFTIYSNQSFTCNVTMLGCAWIQPLMYFQLNNIPMFSGSYIIHKVVHNISPGNMDTTFTGTRMSNLSTPFVDNGLLIKHNSQTNSYESDSIYIEYKKANIFNNCKYKYFNPLSENYGNGMLKSDLNSTIRNYGLNNGGWKIDLTANGNRDIRKATMKELFADIAYGEVGDADDLSVKIIMGVLFNRYKSASNNFCNVLFNGDQHETSKICIPEIKDKYISIAEEIFTLTPLKLVGEQTYISKQVPVWKNFENIGEKSEPKTLTEHDVKSMDSYCTTNGYDTDYRNPRHIYNVGSDKKPLEAIPPSENAYWHKGEYLFQHDIDKDYGHVVVSTGWLNKKPGTEHWQPLPITDRGNSTQYPSNLAKGLFESIKKTIEYSNSINIANIKMEGLNENNKDTIKITCTPTSGMAQVFDIVLNTYYNHFSELHWVVKNNGDEYPSYIQVNTSNSNNKIIAVSTYNPYSYNRVKVLPQYEGLNDLFYLSIQKKYGSLENNKAFKLECRNFSKITNENSWENEVSKLLTYKLIDCQISENTNNELSNELTIGSNKKFSWNGSEHDKNKITPVKPKTNTFSPNKASSKCKENAFPQYIKEKCGNCAKYVREAIMDKNGGGLELSDWPYSACCYAKHLPYWGFNVVYDGVSGKKIEGYTPINGDISVISGCIDGTSSIHGHIQIYYNGLWYSDYPDKDIWCYDSPNGRPFKVFRWNG